MRITREEAKRLFQTVRSEPRVKKAAKWGLIFLLLFSVTGFFILPPLVKSVLAKKLSEKLHREVVIKKLSINPFMVSIKVSGFEVKEPGGEQAFLSFDELYINAQLGSLIKRGIVLSEIRLAGPYIHIERSRENFYNFSDLLKEFTSGPRTDSKPLRFSLNNIQVSKGSVDFLDGPVQTKHAIRDISFGIPVLSNLPYYIDHYVTPHFSANVNGRPVSFQGTTKPFKDSRETSFEVEIKELDIPYYLGYLPRELNFKVLSGNLNAKTRIFYTQYKDKRSALTVAGNVALSKVKVVDAKDNPLVSFPLLDISITSAEVISRNIILSKVLIETPEIHLIREKSGKMNLQSLVPEKGVVLKRKEETPLLSVKAEEVRLNNGRLLFSDLLPEETFRTSLEQINIMVNHFSNVKDEKSRITFLCETEIKEGMKAEGDLTVVPLSFEGTAELSKVALKKYASYYMDKVLFDVKEGALDVSTRIVFAEGEKGPRIKLASLAVALNSLKLRQRGEEEDFLRIPEITIKETDLDLTGRELVVGELSTEKGAMLLKRGGDGKWNLEGLLPAPATPPEGAARVQNIKSPPEAAWRITAKRISLQKYAVKVEDLTPVQPVTVTAKNIRFVGKDITTDKNRKGGVSLSLSLGEKGSLSATGTISINPLSAAMKLRCKDLDIVPLQAYIADKVNVVVTKGALSTEGDLSFSYSEKEGPKAAYKGVLFLTNFASVDQMTADDFLKWKSLHFSDIRAGYNPFSLNIGEVAVADFYSRLIIEEDGSLNVQNILVEGEEKKPEAPAAAAAKQAPEAGEKGPGRKVAVEKVTLQGGTINFTDRHIKPNYTANLLEIGGRVSGLSSEEDKLADVDLKGKLDNYAPLEMTGKINPLKEDLYVDLKVDVKDMDLSPVTPYSGKHIGYTIEKGKLSLALKYLIEKKKLDSQNNIFLDQLTLGEKVDSPDATKLPVRLAIALLKNRKGEISLDVPVSGYIDDPKFSVGRIIIKILVNLLAKAATSPFALLGALVGGGEELSYIDFDYGSSDINEASTKKLDALVKALYDRPSLKLEIAGYVDVEKDREGLRQQIFNRKVKAQKLKEMVKKGLPVVPVDEVKVEKEEYPKYLKMAYKEEKFPKPRNIIGFAKDLPVLEMEKLMLTHIEVKDDDLRLLASQRALKVREHISKSGKVEQERIFLVEAKTLQPEKKEKLRDSRVDFRLK